MVGLGLKLRYIAAVLTVGALLTAAVAVVIQAPQVILTAAAVVELAKIGRAHL